MADDLTTAYMAYLHWARLALEATLDTLRVAPSTRTSLLKQYEDNLRQYLGLEGDGDDNKDADKETGCVDRS